MQAYIGYTFTVAPAQPGIEILIAELSLAGFESYIENKDGLQAYIQKNDWNEGILNEVRILKDGAFTISFQQEEIEQINWNEEWEKNFEAIEVDGACVVRAPFHKPSNVPYDIVIEPKMSFGTGHHETTHMMIQHILKEEMRNKKVLDMGCGTGVLAILSEMKGAKPIDAIDIDNWCYLNSIENAERNQCKHITVYEGDASLLKDKKYDIIIANINRNILLNDIPKYTECLQEKGILFLSGFYTKDIPIIKEKCESHSLKFTEKIEKNNWVSLKFVN